ncbi:hypothetical protein COCNU_09G001810 [Cocos nucifera]|uniref:Uncharacterized protein n=1 Tax=Cocos nucifera TaxID=13894 RepID=A0A8K0IJ75_COCNU|nr:hypothetical protein COCNU_09G001800 [Cocos nucifera]KAG1360718.1 hypothetical protein COCNU_09G001810 [Cocos nucifera]
MEWGLLPPDEAKMVYEKLQKSVQEKLESPDEAALEKTSTCSTKKKRKMTSEAALKAKKMKRIDSNSDGGCGDSISRKKKNNPRLPTGLQPGSLYSPPDRLCAPEQTSVYHQNKDFSKFCGSRRQLRCTLDDDGVSNRLKLRQIIAKLVTCDEKEASRKSMHSLLINECMSCSELAFGLKDFSKSNAKRREDRQKFY